MADEKFKNSGIIDVFIHDEPVGRLAMAPDRRCRFEYNESWLKSGFSISPFYLPLQPGLFTARYDPFDGLFGVFGDSLPDGWGALLIDRWLLKRGIQPATLTPLDRLVLVGRYGMGALTYEPDRSPETDTDTKDILLLAHEAERVLQQDYSGQLELLIRKGESSGGARPKVLLKTGDEEWLIKFPSSSDPPDIGAREYLYSQVAKQCSILMPETRLFENKYFGVKRFDRFGGIRIHVHSVCGLLYASFRYPSIDYTELMKATMALTSDINEVARMFRLMVFNVLTGNRDDHAKNFSFLYYDGRWQLTPAYDLVRSSGFNGLHSTTVAGNGNPSKKDLFRVAEITGFPQKMAASIFDEVYQECREIRLKNW
ncbi:MAG: type II toxin-antitoxin system HipA family toxin [Bacteroidota bacterium]